MCLVAALHPLVQAVLQYLEVPVLVEQLRLQPAATQLQRNRQLHLRLRLQWMPMLGRSPRALCSFAVCL